MGNTATDKEEDVMLENLRNLGKSWVAKALMLFLAASFGVWGIQDVFRGITASALATVGKTKISGQEYQTAYRRTIQNIARSTGQAISAEDARKLGYDKAVLDNLIQQAAVDQKVHDMKLIVSPQAVIDAAKADPSLQDAKGQFNPAALANALRNNGLTEQQFILTQGQNMARGAVVNAVGANFSVPKTVTDALTAFRVDQRDASYFLIKASTNDVPTATDAEIKEQYEKTPAAYTAPEYRSVAVLKAFPADIAATLTVTPDEVQGAYDKYRAQYSIPERRTILQIPFPSAEEATKAKEQIAAGKDFLALAAERGLREQDYTLADKTSDELLDKDIAKAAFALKQGEVSDVIKGALVTALLKVTTVTPGVDPALDQIKDKVAAQAQMDKAKELVQTIYDNVENSRNNQTKLEDIAKEQKLPFILVPATSVNGVDKDGKDVDLPDKAEVLRAAFASDVGDVTAALTPPDGYVWYEVREVIPSALRPLDTIKDKVVADVTSRKIRELLKTRAEKIVAELRAGKALAELSAVEKSDVKTVKALKRNEATADFDIASLTALFALPEQGFGWALEGDGVSAKVMQSSPGGKAKMPSEAETKQLGEGLSQAVSASLTNGYLQALRQEVPVSIDDTVWKQVSGSPQ